jgi:hypothetical protein
MPSPRAARTVAQRLISAARVRIVSYEAWRRIDAAEVERGVAIGKPREKFVSIDEMLGVLQAN